MNKENPLRFGRILREYLELKRLSVADAARKSGLKYDRLEDILSGIHQPGAADALRICYGLEIWPDPKDFEERE